MVQDRTDRCITHHNSTVVVFNCWGVYGNHTAHAKEVPVVTDGGGAVIRKKARARPNITEVHNN